MDTFVDMLIVVAVVLVSLAFLGQRAWRSWRASRTAGCASDCGCAASTSTPARWDQTQVR